MQSIANNKVAIYSPNTSGKFEEQQLDLKKTKLEMRLDSSRAVTSVKHLLLLAVIPRELSSHPVVPGCSMRVQQRQCALLTWELENN